MLSAIGLFCEDIREEKNGANTLIGIMPDNLNLAAAQKMPTPDARRALPRLGMYTRVVVSTDEPVETIRITLRQPNDIELDLATFDAAFIEKQMEDARENGNPVVGFISRSIAAPFVFPNEGRLVLEVRVGSRTLIAGILNAKFVASEPNESSASP